MAPDSLNCDTLMTSHLHSTQIRQIASVHQQEMTPNKTRLSSSTATELLPRQRWSSAFVRKNKCSYCENPESTWDQTASRTHPAPGSVFLQRTSCFTLSALSSSTLLSKVTYSNSHIYGANQHIRSNLGFSVLHKDTSTCRPGESNHQPSDNKTLPLPLNQRCPNCKCVHFYVFITFVFAGLLCEYTDRQTDRQTDTHTHTHTVKQTASKVKLCDSSSPDWSILSHSYSVVHTQAVLLDDTQQSIPERVDRCFLSSSGAEIR